MAKTKISTLAKELNLALPTVFSFLRDKGISIEESPKHVLRTTSSSCW